MNKSSKYHLKLNICLTILIITIFSTTLLSGISEFKSISSGLDSTVLYKVRLPRLVLALISGSMLALTGCVLQGLFRNPLASPDLLGSATAATTSSIFLLYYGFGSITILLIGGVCSSLMCLIAIYLIAGRYGTTTLILAGVAINSLLGSVIALMLSNAKSPWALSELYLWLQGSLELANMETISYSIAFIIIGIILLFKGRNLINALTLGEEVAQTIGINIKKQIIINTLGSAFIIGSIIPQTGVIGFIGLVAPHLARIILKKPPVKLYVTSCLFGALLMLVADIMIWKISFFSGVYIGTLTSFVGAPFLIAIILYQTKRKGLV